MAAVLLVAMFTVHLPYGFSSIKLEAVTAAGPQLGPPGYEVNLLYLACLAALVLGGPGPLAIDGLIKKRRKLTLSQNKPLLARQHKQKRINTANSKLEHAQTREQLTPPGCRRHKESREANGAIRLLTVAAIAFWDLLSAFHRARESRNTSSCLKK